VSPAESWICHRCGVPEGPTGDLCPRCELRLVPASEHEKAPRDGYLGSTLGGRYPILGILGAGGMGAVYRSRHPQVELPLAVKVVLPSRSFRGREAQQRFRREARVLSQLAHPSIVQFYDFGVEPDGTLFLVLEYVEGRTLQWHFEEGGLSARQLVGLTLTVLDALEHAHGRGLLHRDLKPDNIMILPGSQDPSGRLGVKVLDFGLAKLLRGSGPMERVTLTGRVPGTPRYMSPEQAAGATMDFRSDLYSLCTVLYEGLAGRLPFQAADPVSAFSMRLSHEPLPLPQRPDCSEGLRQVLLKGLARHPDQRYGTARELGDALRALEFAAAADRPLPPLPLLRSHSSVADLRGLGEGMSLDGLDIQRPRPALEALAREGLQQEDTPRPQPALELAALPLPLGGRRDSGGAWSNETVSQAIVTPAPGSNVSFSGPSAERMERADFETAPWTVAGVLTPQPRPGVLSSEASAIPWTDPAALRRTTLETMGAALVPDEGELSAPGAAAPRRWWPLGIAAAAGATAVLGLQALLGLGPSTADSVAPAQLFAPRPAQGTAETQHFLETEPPGAMVLDADSGSALGYAPMVLRTPLAPGQQRHLRLHLPGRRPLEISLALDGRDTHHRLVLEPLSAPDAYPAP